VSQLGGVREYRVIDQQRVHEEDYREEVVVALMRDHGDAIMRFCIARLGEGLAEEVAQEVFVAAWEGLLKYRPEVSLQAWLFGIARNKCQQTYRNRARRQAIDEEHLEVIQERAHAQEPMSPEDAIAHATVRGRLHDSLTKLPTEDRILLTLMVLERVAGGGDRRDYGQDRGGDPQTAYPRAAAFEGVHA
jgi:RNA polymerase sigma factor (sigma-70 family)